VGFSPMQMGSLSLLRLLFQAFPILVQLGLPVAATKFIAEYLSTGKSNEASAVAALVEKIIFVTSTGAVVFFLLISREISLLIWGTADYWWILVIGSIVGYLAAYQGMYLGFLQGLGEFKAYALSGILSSVLSFVVSIALAFAGFGIAAIVTGWLAGAASGLSVGILSFRDRISSSPATQRARGDWKKLFEFSLPVFLVMTVMLMVDWIDRVLLFGLTHDLWQLGLYDLAVRGTSPLAIVWSAFAVTVFPTLSELHGTKSQEKIKVALRASSRYLLFLMVPSTIGLAVLSRSIISVLFGRDFTEGSLALSVLALFTVLPAVSALFSSAVQALGRTRSFIGIGVTMLVAEIAGIAILVPAIGMLGAAVGKVTMWGAYFLLLLRELRKVTQVEFAGVDILKTLLCSIIAVFAAAYLDSRLSPLIGSEPALPIVFVVAALIYAALMVFLGAIRKDDFVVLEQAFPRVFGPIARIMRRLRSD